MKTPQHPIPVTITRADGDRNRAPTPPLPESLEENQLQTPEQRTPQRIVQTPLIDIHEGPEGLVLEADLPGVSDQSITIQLEENMLTLQAESSYELPDYARPLHEEFPIGIFQRTFILSDEVDRPSISAEMRNGVLRLLLPKAERAKTRKIEIQGNES